MRANGHVPSYTGVALRGFVCISIYLCLIQYVEYINATHGNSRSCMNKRRETRIFQIHQSYGILHTPNSTRYYSLKQHLVWYIKPYDQWPIHLKIHTFELQPHRGCSWHNMTIRDSNTCAILFGPICSEVLSQTLKLNSSNLLIDFSSSGYYKSKRILITFWVSPPTGNALIKTLHDNNGTLMSPFYASGLGYPTDITVIWRLNVPQGQIIIINVMDLRLEPSGPDCRNDYLAVTDVGHLNDKLLGKFCGIQSLLTLCSKTSSLVLQLSSDSTSNGKGFLAKYSTESPENFQIVSSIPILSDPTGTFISTMPTYKSLVYDVYLWKIKVPVTNGIQLKWTHGGTNNKPSFFIVHEELNKNQYTDHVEIDASVLKEVKALNPLWLRTLLLSYDIPMTSLKKQWESSGNSIVIILGMIRNKASSFRCEYRIQEASYLKDIRCVGPSAEISMVNKSTIFEIQLLSEKQGPSAMVHCKWKFKSMLKNSIKMEVLTINHDFGNTATCEQGGLLFYVSSENDINKTREYGPFCRVTENPVPQVYTPTVSQFVSEESSQLAVILYGYSGMAIKIHVSQAECWGIVPTSKGGLNDSSLNWTLDTETSPLCYHVNGFVSPVSYSLKFYVPEAFALHLSLSTSESAVKENCYHQFMITGCNSSSIVVPQNTSLNLSCSSLIPKSIQVRNMNTCPWTPSYWYVKLKSNINVDCTFEHPKCIFLTRAVCGKILLPLSSPTPDIPYKPSECLVHIFIGEPSRKKTLTSMTYLELKFEAYNLEHCKSKTVQVDEMVYRPLQAGYSVYSQKEYKFSTCDLIWQHKVVRTMTVYSIRISLYKDNVYASNKGNIFVRFKTLFHHFYQMPASKHVCPYGFQYMNHQCYLYHQPDVNSSIMGYKGTWKDANLECQKLNASLLSITNQEEMTVIKELMSSVWAKDMFTHPSIYLYIGLHDTVKVSLFVICRFCLISNIRESNKTLKWGFPKI